MQPSHKIAINTIIMYIRMVFLMLISFFTSRLLLQTLGVNDFGIQSVVGSVSSTFVSLKTLFSESVQRFLNYEKGKGSIEGQRAVFSVSVIIHVVLAIVFFVVVGLIGRWLIINKLDIPAVKLDTAVFVFYMSIVSLLISIFSIPYDAVIISNEKMGIYAIITIIDALLRLGAVLLLPLLPFEMLRSYALLLLIVPIFTLSFQLFYCRHFSECKFTNKIEKSYFKEIFSLSGWNFFGNISFSLVHEGMNMLLNIFGGLVYNASRTIAYQVKNVAGQLTNNTIISARPRIMQLAAIDTMGVYNNVISISRVAFFTVLLPVVMLMAYTDQILDIWLVDVPEYATLFTRLILISVVVRSLHEPLNMMYMSFGKIKRMMIIEAIVMLSFLLFFYLSLKMNSPIWVPFVEMAVMEAVIIFCLLCNAQYEIGFPINDYIKRVIFPFLIVCLASGVLCLLFIKLIVSNSIISTILLSGLIGILYSVMAFMMLDSREKKIINSLVVRFLMKKE